MNTTPRSIEEVLHCLLNELERGSVPEVSPREFSCFAPEQLANHPSIGPSALSEILASLCASDIPTIERALLALNEPTPAWLGFKIVTDPALIINSEDTDIVGIMGEGEGSADARPGLFFANEDKEIVFSRPYSERDQLQMLDITRGPHMHNEQYAGVAWLSLPLEQPGRAFIFGAGEVPLWVARLANDMGFSSVVMDDEASYLAEERFPFSERILINYDAIPHLGISERDYVLVLTRGHMHDPEALIYGINTGAHYVGMMGKVSKNERVFKMAEAKGITAEQIEKTHAPIGLKFGAKSQPELGLCIVAELVQVRAQRRKSH